MFRLSGFFSKQTSRGKIVFTLKRFCFFSGLTTSNPRKRKIIIATLLDIGRMEEWKDPVCSTLSFANGWESMTSMTDWGHWPAAQGKKEKEPESAVSPFVSVATNPIPFSILWCYSFIWHITGVFFGVCYLFFPFFKGLVFKHQELLSFETNPVPLDPLTILSLRRKNFMGARLRAKMKQQRLTKESKQARKGKG